MTRNILRQTVLRFEPNAFELLTECHINFLIFRSLHDHRFQPTSVTGNHCVPFDLVNSQPVNVHQLQRRFERICTSGLIGLRPTRPIFLKTNVEHIALGLAAWNSFF
jgi:hypothetical protein